MTPGHPAPPDLVAEFLAALRLAPRQLHEGLTVWPLVREEAAGTQEPAPCVPLSDALERGTALVEEVSEAGSVSNVRVTSRSDVAVLVLFGEELVGAKQDRAANASFLVPPRGEVVIDVSCVEQGRWERRGYGGGLRGVGSVVSHALRRKMHRKVSRARATGRGFRTDQSEVWEEVADRLLYAGAESDTAAYQDYVAVRRERREEIVRAFKPLPGQAGVVVAMNDEIVGLDAVGDAGLFRTVFPVLLRGYAIDAVDADWVASREPAPTTGASFDTPEPFLEALGSATLRASPSLGLGEDVRIEGHGASGSALLASGRVVHMTAFVDREKTPVAPAVRHWFWKRKEPTGENR